MNTRHLNTRHILIALSLVTTSILGGCATAYVPNTINAPMLRNKGEYRIYGGVNGNVQIAGAVDDHIGVMANAHYVAKREHIVGDTVASHGSGGQFDIGLGYFTTIEPKMSLDADLVAEVYGGAGYGSLFINNKQDGKEYAVSAAKLFIQPAIGFSNKYFDLAFGARLVGLMYRTPVTGYTDAELVQKQLPDRGNPTHAFLEPMVTLRAGFEFLKIQAQVGSSWQLTRPEIVYDGTILGLGLILDIGRNPI